MLVLFRVFTCFCPHITIQVDWGVKHQVMGFVFHQWEGLFLLKCWLGSFSMYNSLRACCVHKGKTGTDEPAQVLTGKHWRAALHLVDWEVPKSSPSPCWQEVLKSSPSACWQGSTEEQSFTLLTGSTEEQSLAAVFTVPCVTHQPVFVMNVKGWLCWSQPRCPRKVAL